ncbi:hypothetical protein D915_005696 [Fasciola hepatica]|uniref:Uncharacterized protein n=1 Tax=Fasciola hepatica TaxID=6192 RepID=A0A4E0R915_FASHE|nr:hypothetical protein D915_005696 [Fasciola hepatica]
MKNESSDDGEDGEIEKIAQLNVNTFKESPYQIKARDGAYFDFHCVDEEPEICYFLFPIELKELEGLSVLEFLAQCCTICPRRQRLYDRVFQKWSQGSTLPLSNFPSALRDIVVCDVPAGSDQVIYELVALNQNTNQELNRELFGLLCAAAERTLFAKMLKDENIPTSPKHFIELAEIHRYRHDYCDLRLDPKLDAFVNLISL